MKTLSFPKVPRIESLHHRLKNAKDAVGQPIDLLDELMVFLEDPPPGVGDRWQAGAELCAAHDIETSRMSVWRFYRVHAVAWRREQAVPLAEASQEATAHVLEQARHLVALRALESLHNPNLPPGVLVGLIQNENRRQEILLARDKFNDQLDTRCRLERRKEFQRIEAQVRFRALFPADLPSCGDPTDAEQETTLPRGESRKTVKPDLSPTGS